MNDVMTVIGGLLSLAIGVLLAGFAFFVVMALGGRPGEAGYYCSENGIGRPGNLPVAEGQNIFYLEDDWAGFPPAQHCRVYALDPPNPSAQPMSAEEALAAAPPPHRLIAEGSYPGAAEYAWVVGALLAPLLLWALFTPMLATRRRRPPL